MQGMRPAVTKSFSPFGADQAYFLKDFVKLLREKKLRRCVLPLFPRRFKYFLPSMECAPTSLQLFHINQGNVPLRAVTEMKEASFYRKS